MFNPIKSLDGASDFLSHGIPGISSSHNINVGERLLWD